MRSLQKFAAVQASVFNHFNQDRSLSGRPSFRMNRAAGLGPNGVAFSRPETDARLPNADQFALVW
jgi:putative transposase